MRVALVGEIFHDTEDLWVYFLVVRI